MRSKSHLEETKQQCTECTDSIYKTKTRKTKTILLLHKENTQQLQIKTQPLHQIHTFLNEKC